MIIKKGYENIDPRGKRNSLKVAIKPAPRHARRSRLCTIDSDNCFASTLQPLKGGSLKSTCILPLIHTVKGAVPEWTLPLAQLYPHLYCHVCPFASDFLCLNTRFVRTVRQILFSAALVQAVADLMWSIVCQDIQVMFAQAWAGNPHCCSLL